MIDIDILIQAERMKRDREKDIYFDRERIIFKSERTN